MSVQSSMAAPDASQLLVQAVQLHQQGQLDPARRLYKAVLRLEPNQPDALHLLGVLALQEGKPADAILRIQRAIEVRPGSAVYHGNLGVALQAVGRLDEAREHLERAVKLDPRQVDATFNLGVTLQTLGLLDEAVGRYRQVVTFVPGHLGARRNLGNALHALDRHEDAVDAYRLALVLAPTDPGLLGSMGASLVAIEQLDEGIATFEKAVQYVPNDPDAWTNLAMALHQASRYDDAMEAYGKALALRPGHVEGWQSLGRVLAASDRLDGAVDCYQRALTLVDESQLPLRLSVMRDLVSALFLAERRGEASEIMRTIVEVAPDDADAWRNLGVTLATSGAIEEAAPALERAVALDPDNADIRSKYVFVLDMLDSTSLERAFLERRAFNAHHALPLAASIQPHANQPDPARRLRVGYVSADFRHHSAATAFLAILELHDPAVVEIVCYSNNSQEDDYTARFKAAASLWRTVPDLTDDELAAQIRHDQIDVLVDLSGYSGGHRLLTFARKPAPVQVTAWGYATGTGLDAMDAFFIDPVLVPPHEERFYSEQVVHLPNALCYTPPPALPPMTPLPALEHGTITLGSYNRSVKITPVVLETWARVMQQLPGSRLVLKPTVEDTPATRERFLGPLARHGIEPERVTILGKHPLYEHLASFGQIDLQLDTFPHSGGVTTLDGLLMGIPCVTLFGERVSGRSSASFVTARGRWTKRRSPENRSPSTWPPAPRCSRER